MIGVDADFHDAGHSVFAAGLAGLSQVQIETRPLPLDTAAGIVRNLDQHQLPMVFNRTV
jgi:hypothetical protein